MNYYEKYPGDYQRDTTHLGLAEHGAYNLLMDVYYSTEIPLPNDMNTLFKMCRAMTRSERESVRSVADQFFPVGDDGLRRHARIDAELEKAHKRINRARENGKKGGRPAKQAEPENQVGIPVGSVGETKTKPSGIATGNPEETDNVTQNVTYEKALHTPDPIQRDPGNNPKGQSETSSSKPMGAGDDDDLLSGLGAGCPGEPAVPTRAAEIAVLLRQVGVVVTPSHQHVLEWALAQVSDEELRLAMEKARRYKPAPERIQPGYLDQILREIRRPAKPALPALGAPGQHSGFDSVDYSYGLKRREDGTYVAAQ